jgi:hypothetical protein
MKEMEREVEWKVTRGLLDEQVVLGAQLRFWGLAVELDKVRAFGGESH